MNETRFVFLDLEMTGLNPETDVILEVAAIVTDEQLKVISEPFSRTIYQPEVELEVMNEVVRKMHHESGLIERVQASDISLSGAINELSSFIKQHIIDKKKTYLAGNSIWNDRRFLERYAPEILDLMHYRLLDVSAIKTVIACWYGEENIYPKYERHRALQDVENSIAELRYYREKFFISVER